MRLTGIPANQDPGFNGIGRQTPRSGTQGVELGQRGHAVLRVGLSASAAACSYGHPDARQAAAVSRQRPAACSGYGCSEAARAPLVGQVAQPPLGRPHRLVQAALAGWSRPSSTCG